MTEFWLRLIVAFVLLAAVGYMFASAWRSMKKADRMNEELVRVRKELKDARKDAADWQAVADGLAEALARRAS